jgi:hypothetical protein
MKPILRPILCIVLFVLNLGVMLSRAAETQNFPNRTIKIIVSTAAGGAPDVIARRIADKLKTSLRQSVVVDNKPGATGNISAVMVANAPADGYTLLYYDSPIWAINPHLYQKLPYDPFKDLMPVAQTHLAPLFLVVPTVLQINSVSQLIEYARKNPGKVSYASAGIGSSHHLTAEQFRSLANINIVHVPYKGGAPASIALSSGEVDMGFLSYPLALAGVQSGKTKILGIGTAARAPSLPDIASISESGLPGFDLYTTLGFLAPAGTPAEVIQKLSEAISLAINEPDMKELVTSYGITLAPKITSSQFGAVMRAEYEKFGQIVKSSGAKMD